MTEPGTLDDLRSAVVARLQSVPALAGIPVLGEDRLDIQAEIAKGLATGGGLVIAVSTGGGRFLSPNLPLPQCEAEIFVECAEVPAVNRGASGRKIPGIRVAVLAVRALHHFGWTRGQVLTATEISYSRHDTKPIVVYVPSFTTRVLFDADLGFPS